MPAKGVPMKRSQQCAMAPSNLPPRRTGASRLPRLVATAAVAIAAVGILAAAATADRLRAGEKRPDEGPPPAPQPVPAPDPARRPVPVDLDTFWPEYYLRAHADLWRELPHTAEA